MNLQKTLEKYAFPPNIIETICSSGIVDLYPPQAEAIKKGILEGKSLLMSVPTAAGKTLIAELCMLKAIIENNCQCLYIAPLKALASEKYQDFKKKYEPFGFKVGLAIGDHDSPASDLNQYNILVATAEKMDSLLRKRAQSFVENLNVVVLDEIHFINDGSRGPTMEILTARLKQLRPQLQILGLSATVSNAQKMADWLGAELVLSDWRPIPLKEGVYCNERIQFEGHGTKMVIEDARDDVAKLAVDTIRGKGQILIFVNARRSTQTVCRQIGKHVAQYLTEEEKRLLSTLARRIVGKNTDATQICQKLGDAIKNGVAFHHAGLKPQQRELVEKYFKQNLIKAISCTPTLAAGVNLPARRAVIRDVKRFEAGVGSAYIPTSEYKQCAGRAGRPQFDSYGEAVMIAKTPTEAETLVERYIHASTEPIISKLGSESTLRIHVLASIAGGYVSDVEGMFNFIEHTFFYCQNPDHYLFDTLSQIFEFLHAEKFIDKMDKRYYACPLGNLTSHLYIDPVTTITIRNAFEMEKAQEDVSILGLIHLMCCTPDSVLTKSVGKALVEPLEQFAFKNEHEFILTPENFPNIEDYYRYLATVKTTWMLSKWIDEEREDSLCTTFNVGPGDIYRHIESIQWLLYAAIKIAETSMNKRLTFTLDKLRKRMRYGIKEELLEVASLRGVGRIRARNLFDHDYKSLNDIKMAGVDKIAHLPTIGRSLAESLVRQVL